MIARRRKNETKRMKTNSSYPTAYTIHSWVKITTFSRCTVEDVKRGKYAKRGPILNSVRSLDIDYNSFEKEASSTDYIKCKCLQYYQLGINLEKMENNRIKTKQ